MKKSVVAVGLALGLCMPMTASAQTYAHDELLVGCVLDMDTCAQQVDTFAASWTGDQDMLDTELSLFAVRFVDAQDVEASLRPNRRAAAAARFDEALSRIASRFEARGRFDAANRVRDLQDRVADRFGIVPSPN
jgi:hypothetical protein